MEQESQNANRSIFPEPSSPVLVRLFERLPTQEITGHYVAEDQTWSHRDAATFSPVKLNREM